MLNSDEGLVHSNTYSVTALPQVFEVIVNITFSYSKGQLI